MFARALSVAVLALCVAGSAFAQWKWRDASGRIQYSDLPPPPGVADKDILQRPAAPARVVAPAPAAASAPPLTPATGKPVETELDAKRKKAEQEEAAKNAAKKKADDEKIAAAKADNCNRARSQLRALDDGIRMARVNAQGEREVLDDAQRAAETKRTRDIIASDCK
jgi:type IV secretory pathway VirB10-like protein